jgi:hypothetical protein
LDVVCSQLSDIATLSALAAAIPEIFYYCGRRATSYFPNARSPRRFGVRLGPELSKMWLNRLLNALLMR